THHAGTHHSRAHHHAGTHHPGAHHYTGAHHHAVAHPLIHHAGYPAPASHGAAHHARAHTPALVAGPAGAALHHSRVHHHRALAHHSVRLIGMCESIGRRCQKRCEDERGQRRNLDHGSLLSLLRVFKFNFYKRCIS